MTLDRARTARTPTDGNTGAVDGLWGICAGIRVMAVDDEEDALGLLRVVLEAAGAEVLTMSSALDALQRLADAKPECWWSIWGCLRWTASNSSRASARPTMPPFGTFRPLRSPPLRGRRIAQRRSSSGFEMHLAKPVDPGELVASIATLVRRRSRGR